MSLIPFRPLSSLSRWPDIWDEDELNLWSGNNLNNLDVIETEDEIIIKANVAGVKAEEVDLTFEKGVLWIKAQHQEEKPNAQVKHYSQASWNYSYKVAVPGTLDLTVEPVAKVTDGVLTVKFTKAEITKPKKLKVS